MWYGMDRESIEPILEICNRENIKFLDFANDSKYVHQNKYFKDGLHLNANGADEFTKDLICVLKQIN